MNTLPRTYMSGFSIPSTPEVRIGWPNLEPLPNEPVLSSSQKRDLINYVRRFHWGVLKKLRTVFNDPQLPPALT